MKPNKYEKAATAYPENILQPFDEFYKAAGFNALYSLSDEFGGSTLYIPKTKTIFRDCLINLIRAEYNGKNIKELAKKYDYSINGIKKLIKDLI